MLFRSAVAWPAVDAFERRRARALALAGEVMEIKLTDELREALGATYSPSVSVDASDLHRGYGTIRAELDVKPSEMAKVQAAVEKVAAEMRAGRISADEFERARRPIIEGFPQRFESNGFWLVAVSQVQSRPDWPDRTRSLRGDYGSITLGEVKRLCGGLFDPRRAVRVQVLGPNDR